ncbi:hypothetical protein F511_32370 [Dorcoceras hygrometricum]|uniref:Uncharacterized protein n=1 Tax=Dorcoceras hygrometricum TaxID=472368 RepID=A0A2Z7AI94_9LAMI|nr:hypothetical protein F511_32370 [Dorcoceras hygrometricum]
MFLVDWAVKMRIRPPELETSICDAKIRSLQVCQLLELKQPTLNAQPDVAQTDVVQADSTIHQPTSDAQNASKCQLVSRPTSEVSVASTSHQLVSRPTTDARAESSSHLEQQYQQLEPDAQANNEKHQLVSADPAVSIQPDIQMQQGAIHLDLISGNDFPAKRGGGGGGGGLWRGGRAAANISTCVTLNGSGIQLAVGPQPLWLRNHNPGLAQRRSTTIGKSRVAIDPIAMRTSWRSNSDITSVTRVSMTFRVVRTNQYNQDLGLIHSTNGNHLKSPKEGSSIDHQVTIYLHAQNITMFPTNEKWYIASQILVSSSGDLILILTAQSTRNMFRIHSDY